MTDKKSPDTAETAQTTENSTPQDPGQYRVLARKYRPSMFSELIGQGAMVRVLDNAIRSGRLAHAFMLTGVRGVGKTTTARIIARGLNCIGPQDDADYGPTTQPCGKCIHCRSIAEDRHVDVLEMDAASRTGVDDIRELIEGVRYRPTSARYKVYIIDEVHMLSKSAFNALLKTLEEPPAHVKFIFATTEIRKVPVTVLSRCQRFDLRRVGVGELSQHFAKIAKLEDGDISETAIRLIAHAADGSVRDGLSLLDQAISQTGHAIGEAEVRDMLGLSDRSQSFDILAAVLAGDAASALDIFARQYEAGADPTQVMEDLLEITHWVTRIKVSPNIVDDVTVAEIERVRGTELAGGLAMSAISRAWQMLLKGLGEVRGAPSAVQAAEMVLVRLAHAASLPSPEEALKSLSGTSPVPGGTPPSPVGPSGGPAASAIAQAVPSGGHGSGGGGGETRAELKVVNGGSTPTPASQTAAKPEPDCEPVKQIVFNSLADIAARAGECREMKLQAFLYNNLRLVGLAPSRIEIQGGDFVDAAIVQKLRHFLKQETREDWVVSLSNETGQATLKEQAENAQGALKDKMRQHPVVRSVLEAFPGSDITDILDHPPSGHDGQDEQDGS